MADSTISVREIMSVPQSKLTAMSQDPRLEVERMSRTSWTERMASSSGRVTSTTIRSAGRSPASTETTTRGNVARGNSPTGSMKYAPIPPPASTKNKNTSERRCRSSQAAKLIVGRW